MRTLSTNKRLVWRKGRSVSGMLRVWSLMACAILLMVPLLRTHTQVAGEAESGELSRGFRAIQLGMALEDVKQELLSDPYFDYRGDPDVSFLPRTYQSLIECRGNAYIERAFFQFDDERLSIIILVLDRSILDHYSIFTRLNTRYGPFSSLDPEKVTWTSEQTVLTLERPLTVKYIDRAVFDDKQERGRAEEDLRKLARQRFIENF